MMKFNIISEQLDEDLITIGLIDSKCCSIINLIMVDILNNNFKKDELRFLFYLKIINYAGPVSLSKHIYTHYY